MSGGSDGRGGASTPLHHAGVCGVDGLRSALRSVFLVVTDRHTEVIVYDISGDGITAVATAPPHAAPRGLSEKNARFQMSEEVAVPAG
jgi:hypothetical protein